MSADIGPGVFVECVASAGPDSFGNSVAAGAVYRVEFIAPFNDFPGNPEGDGVKLCNIGDPDCLWVIERFRPIYRPRADLIEHLKQPAPREPVDA